MEKEARFYKGGSNTIGYVNIHASTEGGPEADYLRTVDLLKALGIEIWHEIPSKTDNTSKRRPRCADAPRAGV